MMCGLYVNAAMNPGGTNGLFQIIYPFTLAKGTAGFTFGFNNFTLKTKSVDAKSLSLGAAYGIIDNLELSLNASHLNVTDDPSSVNFEYPFCGPKQSGLGYASFGVKFNVLEQGNTGLGVFGHFDIPLSGEETRVTTSKTKLGFDLLLAHKLSERTIIAANAGYQINQDPDTIDIGDNFSYAAGIETGIAKNLSLGMQFAGKAYTGSDLEQHNPLDAIAGIKFEKDNYGFSIGYKKNLLYDNKTVWNVPGPLVGSVWIVTGKHEKPAPCIPVESVQIKGDSLVKIDETRNYQVTFMPPLASSPIMFLWECSNNGQIQGGQGSLSVTVQWAETNENSWIKVTASNACSNVSSKLDITVEKPILLPKQEFFFALDSYDLGPASITDLEQAVEYLKYHPEIQIIIEGHTCSIATEEYNLALGEHRAEAIKSFLTNHGIAEDRIKTITYGESKPGYNNSEEITRKKNRRAYIPLN
jgi:OOP family OmpA-OmpF porin